MRDLSLPSEFLKYMLWFTSNTPVLLLVFMLLGCVPDDDISNHRTLAAGYIELDLLDAKRDRPVITKIWYPSAAEEKDLSITYDLAFKGRAIKAAQYLASASPRPLVVLSHGDRGSNVDQSWLAESLAANGYIVAAAAHWMNTWKNNTPEATLRVWERAKDLQFVLTTLLNNDVWGARIDPSKVAAAGHSVGGYTALALAGAIYNPQKMADYCAHVKNAQDCSLAQGASLADVDFSQADASYRDKRVAAVLAMAPALGQGIDVDSLAQIEIPVLIIAALDDELLPLALNAQVYAQNITGARLSELKRGGHFVFMPECSFMGKVFTYFHRFDICGHRTSTANTRAKDHAEIERQALAFFSTNIPVK